MRYLLITLLTLATLGLYAQGYSLEYSDAKIISSTQETVPTGKVWKVTAVYGVDADCLLDATKYVNSTWGPYTTAYVARVNSSLIVNGEDIPSYRKWKYSNSPTNYLAIYTDAQCTSESWQTEPRATSFDIDANPNIFPMWLPAGTTLKSSSSKVFISAVEFNLVAN